jgi:hypothetical protein
LSVVAGGGVELPEDFQPNFGPIEGRTVLGRWKISDPEMDVNYTPLMDVVFADSPWGDQRVTDSLRRIGDTTEALMAELAMEGKLG